MCNNAEVSYTYLFIRKDLSVEQHIIQTAHAIHQMALEQKDKEIPHAALIGVENERELQDVKLYLAGHGIDSHMFYEPDIGAYTALATFPLKGHERDPLVGFELYRFPFDARKDVYSKHYKEDLTY